jgi:lysine-specific histone demethylase 1B
VIDAKGVVYPAEKTIVTVPLSILKQGIIQFDPPLPTEKINQFNSFGMDTGIKMFLRFSKTWWPEDMGSIILEDSLPEIWATSQGKEAVLNRTLTVFVMGAGAEILSQLEPQAAVNRVLGRLEYYLGVGLAQDLQKWHIQDWSKESWIQGAYSYAKAGAQANRKVLRQPVNQQIYFAGEAMNDVHYATVHGAMESAQRAVWEIGTS